MNISKCSPNLPLCSKPIGLASKGFAYRPGMKIFCNQSGAQPCEQPAEQNSTPTPNPQIGLDYTQQTNYGYPYPYSYPPIPSAADTAASTATLQPQPSSAPYPGMAMRSPQDFYSTAPYQYYPPPVYASAEGSPSGAPWFVWVGLGIIAANIIWKVQEFTKSAKSPQQMMSEMAMNQTMNSMGGGAGLPGGMAAGFGQPGGVPMPPNMPSTGFTSPSDPRVDTPGTDCSRESPAEFKGAKFNARMNGATLESAASTSASPSVERHSPASPASPFRPGDTVEENPPVEQSDPIVREPPSSSSPWAGNLEDSFSRPGTTPMQQAQKAETDMLDAAKREESFHQIMKQLQSNPEMQKMLFPSMSDTVKSMPDVDWVLSSPEVKQSVMQMLEQQKVTSAEVLEMLKSMDCEKEVNKQLQELGLKPQDAIIKITETPDLAEAFSRPKVQSAIMDIIASPNNVSKYQDEPEIMNVVEQVSNLFGSPPSSNQATRQ